MKCQPSDLMLQSTDPRLRDPVLPHGVRPCVADCNLVSHLKEARQRKRPD